MLHTTMFREQTTTDPSGRTIGMGQDALPYADDRLLIVADGMGGRGFMPHPVLPAGMFDENTVTRVLFGNLFKAPFDPLFSGYELAKIDSYVQKSFEELIALGADYGTSEMTTKHSAYFGSRLASALMMLLTDKIHIDKTVDSFRTYSEAARREKCDKLAQMLSEYFEKILGMIGEQIGLEVPGGKKGFPLMPTTLSTAICFDRGDTVDVLYVRTGDSRCYVWNEQNGLMQVFKDCKGADGSMSHYISGEKEYCRVFCDFKEFKKPCMLFNATDGCYGSEAYLSPMSFEYLMVDCLSETDSMDAFSDLFKKQYDDYLGAHDDSSSMAMTAFGYASYAQFQSAACRRKRDIEQQYLEQVPDLLLRRYNEKDIDRDNERRIAELEAMLKGMIETNPKLWAYCEDRVANGKESLFADRLAAFDEEKTAHERLINEKRKQLESVVEFVWPELTDLQSTATSVDPRDFADLKKEQEKYEKDEADYRSDITACQAAFAAFARETEAMLTALCAAGPDQLLGAENPAAAYATDEHKETMGNVFRYIQEIQRRSGDIGQWKRDRKNYFDKCRRIAGKYPALRQEIVRQLEEGELCPDGVTSDAHREAITMLLGEIEQCRADYTEQTASGRQECMRQCVREYWDARYETILQSAGCQKFDSTLSATLSEKEAAAVKEAFKELKVLRRRDKNYAVRQRKLFEQYEYGYSRLMREETA